MRINKKKEFSAVLSMASVMITLVAASMATMSTLKISRDNTLLVTMGLATVVAAVAASMSIIISRRLSKLKQLKRVFLIYAREDVEIAKKLSQDLTNEGFEPWLDVEKITPGEVWQKSVIRALQESPSAIVLLSKNLNKKGFVQTELKGALEILQQKEKDFSSLIPIRLDESVVPENLSHIQWVQFGEEGAFERIVKGLKRIIDVQEVH